MDEASAIQLGQLERFSPSLLMKFDQYAEVRTRIRTPHVLDIRRGQGRLHILGVRHCHDPRDPVFSLIEAQFRRVRPTLVFLEGGRPTPLPTLRDNIGAYGEAGLLAALARRARVATRSLEPWRLDEAQDLWTSWPREAVKLFYLLRDLATWHRGHRAVSIEQHAGVLLDNLSRGGLTGLPRRPEDLDAVTRQHLPSLADWRAVPDVWFDPARYDLDTWTNEASRRSSRFRDLHAVRHLGRAVMQGERVMTVVGFTHSVMQAAIWRRWCPTLREVGGLAR